MKTLVNILRIGRWNKIEDIQNEKVGVVLLRGQPIHNAHMHLIRTAYKENDKVLALFGSSNKVDMLRNPFSIDLRSQILYETLHQDFDQEFIEDKVEIAELPDWTQEEDQDNLLEWGPIPLL